MTISLTEDACFIGIDFSGGSQPWRSQVRNPRVWIATIRVHGGAESTWFRRRVREVGELAWRSEVRGGGYRCAVFDPCNPHTPRQPS